MITLVLGGARSGKSSYAEAKVAACTEYATKHYLATAQALDEEMERRISHHRTSRSHDWVVEEIPLALAERIECAAESEVILVDCLTLWMTNVIVEVGDGVTPKQADRMIQARVAKLIDALTNTPARVVLVSNEVGLGIMPMGEVTRRYVDHAGWMNQAIAKVADNVVFIAAGLPLKLKGEG
ncbi:bifunctional adenosylcobinamide kinase/adenosylcobinamide-phosphate guanylyltransferase [Vibrio astriarenae]|uniref:bifunctional adenosylcobinamide kinase/adenosylcobinamide-phosphate guanylyltransferase n=1 Tax=Vibrio astriarenae TaxID=1481923 RepID=UPI00373576EA